MTAPPHVLFLDQSGALAGGQTVLCNLIEAVAAHLGAQACGVAAPTGEIDTRLAKEAGLLAFQPVKIADWLTAVRFVRDGGWVVANSPKVLPAAVYAKASALLAGRRVQVAFIVHSNPSTAVKAAAITLLALFADVVVPVAHRQWLPRRLGRRAQQVPPLGLRSHSVLPQGEVRRRMRHRPRAVKAMGRRDPVKGLDIYREAAARVGPSDGWTYELATSPAIEGDAGYELALLADLGPLCDAGRRDATWFEPGDVVVVPSRRGTACLVAQEALARGAFVVASAVGDIPRFVTHGSTGLLVSPGDPEALAQALRAVTELPEDEFEAACLRANRVAAARADGWYDAVVQLLAAETEQAGC